LKKTARPRLFSGIGRLWFVVLAVTAIAIAVVWFWP
jgi:hypothetical protein